MDDSVVDLGAGVLCELARLQPTLNSFVYCKEEFCSKEFVQCNLVPEVLLVLTNRGQQKAEA